MTPELGTFGLQMESSDRLESFLGVRPTSDKLRHLDLLRFIAAVGIVFHHSHEFFYSGGRPRLAAVSQTFGLSLFVDVFFCISGFVIAYVYSSRIASGTQYGLFLQRRVGRLFPLHWVTLALSIALFFVATKIEHMPLNHEPSFSLGCVTKTAFLAQGYLPCSGEAFNGVSWSISAEMVMYVTFPVFAWLGRRASFGPMILSAFAFVLLVWVLTSFSGTIRFSAKAWTDLYAPLRALPAFTYGVGLFHCRGQLRRLPCPGVFFSLGTAALILLMFSSVPAVFVLACGCLVVTFGVSADMSGVSSKIVRKLFPLGQLTYSIYMLHGIFILLIMNGLGDKVLHAKFGLMLLLSILCYVCIFLASYFSFNFIETPGRRWIDALALFPRASVKPSMT